MTMYKNKYRVETTRLPAWDYSAHGYYFVTICARGKQYFFGDVIGATMVLSDLGRAARDCWAAIPEHFPLVAVDEFVVTPNHVHGVIIIRPDDRLPQSGSFGPQSRNLGSIVRGYKIGVKKCATEHGLLFDWQPRFYEHVTRDEESLGKIRNYIVTNPVRWESDEYNIARRAL